MSWPRNIPEVERVQRRLVISGRVQGVFFRQSTRERAQALGLTGWVRNRQDGAVEAVLQGPAEAVDAMLRWCQRGPPGAQVSNVEVVAQEIQAPFPGFSIRRTE